MEAFSVRIAQQAASALPQCPNVSQHGEMVELIGLLARKNEEGCAALGRDATFGLCKSPLQIQQLAYALQEHHEVYRLGYKCRATRRERFMARVIRCTRGERDDWHIGSVGATAQLACERDAIEDGHHQVRD